RSGVAAFRFFVTGNQALNRINLRVGFETGNANWDWVAPDTAWHHLVGTNDGSSARLYFDGTLVAGPSPAPYAGGASAHPFWIGAGDDSGFADDTWPGSIDEVAVYGSALTATQVSNHKAAAV